jgi:tetratricopeptide (TPR) repeat protein
VSIKLIAMVVLRTCAIPAVSLAIVFCSAGASRSWGQSATDTPAPAATPLSSLNLPTAEVSHLSAAVAAHDYIAAESLLIGEIEKYPNTPQSAPLLAYLGSVYFLNHDFFNAAVAWKKSDAIRPLNPQLKFSLAMAYIRISHPDWARTVLTSLAANDSKNALYPYWLGRLDYDSRLYSEAAAHFRHALTLDVTMSRAYDNLGLCLFYQNENAAAVENFKKAIELDRNAGHPTAWPYVNLAITQQFLGQSQEAETNLREAVRLDAQLPVAHYQLGILLEDAGKLQEALIELKEAARLDDAYAEPHITLAHIYNKLGRKDEARQEVAIYTRLHKKPREAAPTP